METSSKRKWWNQVFCRIHFLSKLALILQKLLSNIRDSEKFGYVQCDMRVPDNLKEKLEAFPPIYRKPLVSLSNIREFMKKYAGENKLLTQAQRMVISSFRLINGTIITPPSNFYLDHGRESTQIHRFVQYTPLKCFISFVQSAVNAQRERDENPLSSVVAETMKPVANNSWWCQIMDRSWHTLTKYMTDEKARKTINNKFSKT